MSAVGCFAAAAAAAAVVVKFPLLFSAVQARRKNLQAILEEVVHELPATYARQQEQFNYQPAALANPHSLLLFLVNGLWH